MSSTAHSEEPSAKPSHRRKIKFRTRLLIAVAVIGVVVWQLNAVIWGVHGLAGLLEAGQAPRAFLGTLLSHVYQAVVSTLHARAK